MNNYKRSFLIILSVAFIFAGACGGNSTEDMPPSIPDLSQARPSFEFFKGKVIGSAPDDNYQLARSLTVAMEAVITGFSSLPDGFLSSAENENASFNNGVWTWEYSASGGGESISIRLTAEETNSQVNWAMYLSLSTPEISFENYKFLDGNVKDDGNEGEWNFYPFQQESTNPVMTYDWDIASETEATFTITFSDASFSSIEYAKNSPDNTLTITDANHTTVIYWNETTGEGYYDVTGGNRVCWDSNSQNVACIGV